MRTKNRKSSKEKFRLVELDEVTYVYRELAKPKRNDLDFNEKDVLGFIKKVRRKIPLERIDQQGGYIFQMDPLDSLFTGTLNTVQQSLCIPLAKNVTEAKGFETITFPKTTVLEARLGETDVDKTLSSLGKEVMNWVTEKDYVLGNFWRLQNRFDAKGTLERVAQIEIRQMN